MGKSFTEKLATVIFGLYLVPAFFFACYFEWQYAVEHGFLDWLLIGSYVAIFKALLWPFFI